jgi:hypothetical protein
MSFKVQSASIYNLQSAICHENQCFLCCRLQFDIKYMAKVVTKCNLPTLYYDKMQIYLYENYIFQSSKLAGAVPKCNAKFEVAL